MQRAIEASVTVPASVSIVRSVLRDRADAVIGAVDYASGSPHRFRTTIPAELGSGTSVEQEVLIDLGPVPAGGGDHMCVSLHWEPTDRERVLPSFTGELVVEATAVRECRLTIRGSYEAPLGPVGRFGDSLVGHRIARRSLAAFAARLAERIEHEGILRQQETPRTPTPYNVDLRGVTGWMSAARRDPGC